jgi:hypothetical protein
MTDHQTEIAAATLEHSERIRWLTESVERQRGSIRKLGGILGVLVALLIWREFTRDSGHGILIGESLILEGKGTLPMFLTPTESGLAIRVSGRNEESSSEYLLKSSPGELSILQGGRTLWRTQ